ncbi:hypothetical protein GGD66_001757 [Bradyrhizobium sp. CIR48]|nr:hypothetical protein [Bradyrhizobium sp. CIR48]
MTRNAPTRGSGWPFPCLFRHIDTEVATPFLASKPYFWCPSFDGLTPQFRILLP